MPDAVLRGALPSAATPERARSDNATPSFDPQMTVYASLLTLLDKAITDLGAGGTGPDAADLVYGGNAQKWIEAAHTLKARIYLHQVEKLGLAQYTSALTEAKKGISAPANDWKSQHSSNTSERNMWAQFANTSFGPDLVAAATMGQMARITRASRRDVAHQDYIEASRAFGIPEWVRGL